ncbi:hypothetical protein GTY41_20250 [Streptomyces sp. SID685]|uniref:hypothetical protein n=1 Tax=Streptomyces TaxID=1883 RepID=UPI001367BE0F|nr:hypothetical protein [Streptomyces sp. SID685]MYR87206.1 hypothetical protein [Streptomyces sp. SID685]
MTNTLNMTVRYPGDRTAVLVVTGDIDLHTGPVLRTQALTVAEQGAPHLVLNLAQVD